MGQDRIQKSEPSSRKDASEDRGSKYQNDFKKRGFSSQVIFLDANGNIVEESPKTIALKRINGFIRPDEKPEQDNWRFR